MKRQLRGRNYEIRLVIIQAATLGLVIGTEDIKGAYMQSGPIRRDLYVRPTRDCHRKEESCGNF